MIVALFKSLFQRKPVNEIPALKTERAGGIGFRIAKAAQRNYKVNMALLHDGKPQRQFAVIIKANSRDNAVFLAGQKITIQAVSAQLDRSEK